MEIRHFKLFLGLLLALGSCKDGNNEKELDLYFENSPVVLNHKLTDVIVSDIFTPPVSSRIYAYSNIAGYEAVRFMDGRYKSLAGQLNELQELPKPQEGVSYHFPLASMVAFTEVAQALVFDREAVQKVQETMLDDVKEIGMDKEIYQNSVEFGKAIGEHILQWARKDGYNERTALPRYTVTKDPGRWRPTPPGYLDAIEPHWNRIRPFVLDSAAQFDPGPPTPFDEKSGSAFYNEAIEVYNAGLKLDQEQKEIAEFWDCNPNESVTQGHVMYFNQKISPGGHWMHIAVQAIQDMDSNLSGKQGVLAGVSIAIADAFISCWDQKYKSDVIRPETYINTYVDPDWSPVLQTPPFPEYTSGHSVASAAAATVLTDLVGAKYSFIDSTEVPYGLPKRNFDSFMHAAEEAAISRFYGGIHYRPAVEKGLTQGKAVGSYVLDKLKIM